MRKGLERAYIGIGSNLGDPLVNCRRAIQAILADSRNRPVGCSPLYRTEPVGKKDQDWFVNGVLAVDTSLPPRNLLHFLQGIEKAMGRIRKERFGPRIIDLDILLYGDRTCREEDLQIPHPRLAERRFVLAPLQDLAPDLLHPETGRRISELLAALPQREKVIPLPEADPCPV